MIDLTALFSGIKTRWDSAAGDTLRGLATGGLWAFEAPHGSTPPYVIWSVPGEDAEYTFQYGLENVTVQFSVFSDSASPLEALNIGKELSTVYDDVLLTVTGYTVVKAERISSQPLDDPDKGYEYVVQYEYRIQQT